MHFPSLFSAALSVVLLGSAVSALAAVTVQDPAGKVVVTIEKGRDTDIVKDAAGKTVLTITDDKIVDASGKLVLYCNGDMTRDKPEGKLYLYKDGRHIKREPGGANLLYMDGNDLMNADRTGKPLYKFTGEDSTSPERIAAIYILMPELFGKDAASSATSASANNVGANDAAILANQAKAAASSDAAAIQSFAAGTYTTDIYRAMDSSPDLRGTVIIAKVGDVYAMDFQLANGVPARQGVAFQHGDELWCAVGAPATVGLAIYHVDAGKLTGIWYNVTGKPESFGTETAAGAATLGGDYKITDAKAPFTQAPYVGTLTLEATDKKFDGTDQIYTTFWDLGGYKARGVGATTRDGKILAVATSTGPEFQLIRFKIDLKNNSLVGQFYTDKKVPGMWNLKKQK